MNSFKSYARMKEMEELEHRRKSRQRVIVITISTLLLLAIVIGAAIGVAANKRGDSWSQNSSPSMTSAASIKALCSVTRYPDSCISSISSTKGSNDTTDPKELFKLSLEVAINALSYVSSMANALVAKSSDTMTIGALEDCKELFDDAVDRLNDSIALLKPAPGEKVLTPSKIDDLRTWLSAAVTDQETCLDGLDNTTGDSKVRMAAAMLNSTQFTSNSLAIVSKILGILDKLGFPTDIHRKLLAVSATGTSLPAWVSSSPRRTLLQDSRRLKPNVIVAKDGSGQFKTIKEALNEIPNKSDSPFVIYIKEGVYKENVLVDKNKWNVVMMGDGMHKTIITGSKNKVDGVGTFKSGTLIVEGKKFMARDMGFQNTAGPEKEQAVAMRSSSDRSIFFRCSFEAFQDTVYAHSLRQFYRDCDIVGTVDFIFGDSPVVLQNCTIRPRQPLPDQKNIITAQGRTDPNENTGISIQGCTITPYDNVMAPTYLGRPWKDYSTTVFIRSKIDGMVAAQGWLEWSTGTVPPATIYYAEFHNTGLGSDVSARVTWPGYHPTISSDDAAKFAVPTFIQGDDWIKKAGVDFQSTL